MRIATIALWLAPVLTASAQVTPADLEKSPNADWLTYAGDYRGTRHSPLTQIHTGNVNTLTAKWAHHWAKVDGLRMTPIVYQGVMYITAPNAVRALDARNGRQIWEFRDTRAKKSNVNRGAAIHEDAVFFVTSDCYLTSLDRGTGAVRWQKQYADCTNQTVFSSAAPLIVKDKVMVGIAGGDHGLRGFVAALSVKTGDEVWRLWTIPARGEKGSETWGNYIEYGGGGTWLSGTYDPGLNMLYWTTGNTWPDFYAADRPGDNLYTSSLLGIDADTGKMKWYFQFTPNDTRDWDAQSWPILIDLPFQGKPRKLVVHANRNGFFYTLDRETGQFLNAAQMVDKMTWAKGIDAKGRPMEIPGMVPTPEGKLICPGVQGAANWNSSSYNPATKLVYVPNLEQCDTFTSSAQKPEPFKGFSGGGAGAKPKDVGQFFLRAIDPVTGKRVWEYPMTGPAVTWAGTVTTAGGLVFFGDDDGHLVAVDAKSGKHLWHFQMGEPLTASPITYAVDGKQYVAIASSTAVFAFGLFEPVQSTPVVRPRRLPR
ncbi:MAG: PQQ-binding-like beta-propeller repeat protein [Bryobacterales bacterium]|nr:PQQ-binding-like beta-propeller repeat protein [Bryobacterales bacterium]